MATTAEQIRSYRGPALFSNGFRPFFLLGAAWCAAAMALTLPMMSGVLSLPTAFSPAEWHAHEMIYGYVPAVVAGFLLTAVPNWTGRLPVVGAPLAALVMCWLAGRGAVVLSSAIGRPLAALIDVSFLAMLALVVGREIIAARNTRNLKVLGAVVLLLTGNIGFHVESAYHSMHGYGERAGIAVAIVLVMLVGGRIIPSFTRNWLVRRGPGKLPAAFDRLDQAAMAVAGIALVAWVAAPASETTGWLATVAATAQAWRLYRWAGYRTLSEPLVLILHVAYAFVPVGFALAALSILLPGSVVPTGALHGWTAGVVGLMTLAVMTRASLGHTGQSLTATLPISAIYLAALLAAVARITAAFDILREPMLHLSAASWIAAFLGFVVVYSPLLARPRA